MAQYTQPTLNDFANFTGESNSDSRVADWLLMGWDLLWMATDWEGEIPDGTGSAWQERFVRIVDRAIMAVADGIAYEQGVKDVMRSPFASETIGSYSYQKSSASAKSHLPTGLLWFDLAVMLISRATANESWSTGDNIFHITDPLYINAMEDIIGPAEVSAWIRY